MLSGFPPEFTLAKAGAGMTTFYEVVKNCLHSDRIWFRYRKHFREELGYVENLRDMWQEAGEGS